MRGSYIVGTRGAVEVVGSTIKAGGNVELFLPGIWEMAFRGNDAQLARNLSKFPVPVRRELPCEPLNPLLH